MNNTDYLTLGVLFLIVMFITIHLYIYNKDLKLKILDLESKIDILELKNKKYKFYIELKDFILFEFKNLSIETEYFLSDSIIKEINNNKDYFYIESSDKLLIQSIFRLIIRFNLKNNKLCDINIEYKTNNNILTFKIK